MVLVNFLKPTKIQNSDGPGKCCTLNLSCCFPYMYSKSMILQKFHFNDVVGVHAKSLPLLYYNSIQYKHILFLRCNIKFTTTLSVLAEKNLTCISSPRLPSPLPPPRTETRRASGRCAARRGRGRSAGGTCCSGAEIQLPLRVFFKKFIERLRSKM